MISFTATCQPTHKQTVLLCVDAAFFPYALALIAQIHARHPDLAADYCLVCENRLVVPSTLSHLPIRLCQIAIDRDDDDFPVSEDLPFATYLRLFAVEALAKTYERILYLDSDIMYQGRDLGALLNVPLRDGHCLAAVRDTSQQKNLLARPDEAALLESPTFPYFNAGVMVIDPQRWSETDMLGRTLSVIQDTPNALIMFDQSALNLALRGDWSELSPDWNFLVQRKHKWVAALWPPEIVHFISTTKPWTHKNAWLPRRWSDWYETFLLTHFNEFTPEPPQLSFAPWHKGFMSNFRAMKWAMRYRRRFRSRGETIDPWT